MAPKKFYIPRKESECSTRYTDLDRPENDAIMFYNDYNGRTAIAWNDSYSGDRVNFGATLTGTDNKIYNMNYVWRKTSNYGQFGGYTKVDNYLPAHFGAVPGIHPESSIVGYRQHILPSYIGLRFEYRWPYDNDVNYWSNSPVHINDMMFHYYNPATNQFFHYAANLISVSVANSDLWPDRFVRNDSRRSDSWKGCYWKPTEGAVRNIIRNTPLFMIGVSMEFMFSDRGTAKHSRCMDIRNMTPIYDRGGAQEHRPILAQPEYSPWTTSSGGKQKLYLL